MSDKFPNPDEIRKEFERFAKDKFGGNIQFFSNAGPQPASESQEPEVEEKKDLAWNFDLTPRQVKEYLDRFVIKQDEAKKALAIAVCDHYNHVRACFENPELTEKSYAKQNVLILGPTGVGKTYLVRQIAKLVGVPFVKADATRFTETGFVGANVDDLIKDLVSQAGNDLNLAQYGIIYLDEADKLASSPGAMGKDVSGRGVQFGLLKIMEESEVDLRSGNDISSQMQALMEFQTKGKVSKKIINTRHILFIVSGAFTGLKDIIQKRLQQKAIGITANPKGDSEAEDNFKFATTQDYVDFGFEPEFIGRLPVRANCEHLNPEDLYDILNESEESIILQYKEAFAAYGIKVHFEEEALREIAELASKEKTGARALMTVCERILRDFKFELPSTDLTEFTVNREVVQNPDKTLEELLSKAGRRQGPKDKASVRHFEKSFFEKHGLKISFTEKAIGSVTQRALEEGLKTEEFCRKLLNSYEHGLNLIKQNTGQTEFILDEEVVEDSKKVLEAWVSESYKAQAQKNEESS